MLLIWGQKVKLMKLGIKRQPFQDMSSHSTSEVRKSWGGSCFLPKCSWQSHDVKQWQNLKKRTNKHSYFQVCQAGQTGDLFEMLVELFGMPPFLWFSFQFPFFIVHFHGSITRPIILFSFYLFFFTATRDRGKKKKKEHRWHLVYGRLSTLLLRMLFGKPTCQWHTIKTAFQIRIFMQRS